MKKLILTLLLVLGLLGFTGAAGSFAVAAQSSCGDQDRYGTQPALPDQDKDAGIIKDYDPNRQSPDLPKNQLDE